MYIIYSLLSTYSDSMKVGENIKAIELRESLIIYYENKLAKGVLMVVDDIYRVKTATEKELQSIKEAITSK